MPTRQHFVTFRCPGTFVDEEATRPIDAWDPVKAVTMAEKILVRYNAKPYGFFFVTRLIADPIPDGEGGQLDVEPKEVERSGVHYLGGTVFSYDDILERKGERDERLSRNMRSSDMPYVCVTMNSTLHHGPFHESDVVVDVEGKITERGNSPERMAYRKKMEEAAAWAEYRSDGEHAG